MLMINFGHPLSEGVREQVEHAVGDNIVVQTIRVQADQEKPFGDQAKALIKAVELSPEDWQTQKFVVQLPGLAALASCILAEIHGRCGYFPSCIRLKPIKDSQPPQFVFAEIINLHVIRNVAREQR